MGKFTKHCQEKTCCQLHIVQTRAEHLVFAFDGNTPLRIIRQVFDACIHDNSTSVEPATSALFMMRNLTSFKV